MIKHINKLTYAALCASLLATNASSNDELQKVMKARGLSEVDVVRAAKTYLPSGGRDEYVVFSSGGQSGQIIVYGVPSMKILKYIAVFTPEPWQGYGYDENSKAILRQGNINGKEINWGDTHHPGLSETDGKYDGKYLFINDKANPRVAVIHLDDFETKQIVVNPVFKSEHGGSFVTPNTEFIIEACQYAAPFDNGYHPIEEYKEVYRGGVTMWPFDKKSGYIVEKDAFTIEMPPYMQDLSDSGKRISDGWGFTNSFNSEMYTGGIEVGLPPNEAGMSRNDTDFLHVYNWRKLAEVAKDPKNVKMVNNHKVIPIDVAVKNDALFLIPEPKSPHGVDVDPSGKYIVVCGKLDTHTSVYDFEKIQKLIKNKEYAGKDPYGIPILDMKKALHGQVELGLGPLHSQFSPDEFAKNDQKIVVIFDEFQEIVNLELEAKIRSIIQHHSNKVSYIFMGSKKSLLHEMFLDKNRPFYKSVKHFKIQEIKKESWSEFIKTKFGSTGKSIDDIYIDKIFTLTKGFPYYTQQFAFELWNNTTTSVDNSSFDKTLNIVIDREEDLFAMEWDNLTQNQKKVLKIVVQKDGVSLYDEQYFAKYEIKSSSFQTALNSLMKKDVVDKNGSIHYISDPLFEYWVKKL